MFISLDTATRSVTHRETYPSRKTHRAITGTLRQGVPFDVASHLDSISLCQTVPRLARQVNTPTMRGTNAQLQVVFLNDSFSNSLTRYRRDFQSQPAADTLLVT